MTKYRQIFNQMLEENEKLFEQFTVVHQQYILRPGKNQEEFNQLGIKVTAIIKQYENRLCGRSEKGIYANFSSKLAEKFWELVRQKFPKIDFVGVKVIKPVQKKTNFEFKKISFS